MKRKHLEPTLPEYISLYVNVTLHEDGCVTCRPNQLNIPGNSTATITWVPTSDNFTFKHFRWCKPYGFLSSKPIIHGLSIISAVHNSGDDEDKRLGDHRYQLTVEANGVTYTSPNCPEAAVILDDQPKINNQ